jgi:polar amino acid transport system substrate-binding protein
MLKNYKKIIPLLLSFLVILCSGCSSQKLNNIDSLEQLKNKNVGIYNGSEYDKYIIDSKPLYYNTYSDEISALRSGKIDAFLTDEPIANEILKENNDLQILDKKLTDDSYAFAINKDNYELKKEIDSVIIQMKKDGILEQFKNKWITGNNQQIENYTYESTKTIKFATVSGSAPFAYLQDNEVVGYDIDVINYIGYKLGYKVEIIEMAWGGVLPSIISGKADVAGCSIIVTEERKKSLLFTEPDYSGGIVVVTRDKKSFSSNFIKSIKRTILDDDRYVTILKGIKNTCIISFASIFFGSILGVFVCLLKRIKNKVLSVISKIYINIIQGIPITLLLLIFYYVIFGKININSMLIAIITFSIYFSAYMAEIVYGCLESINKKQLESAYSLGFTKFQAFKYIIFPQILNYLIPVYKNEIVSLIKLTSIVGYISILDITRASDLIRNKTYEAFVPLIIAALVYYLLCTIVSKLLDLFYNKRGGKLNEIRN